MSIENKNPSFFSKINTLKRNIHSAIKEQKICLATPGEFRKWITMETHLPTWVKQLSINLPAKMRIHQSDYYIQDEAGLADYFAFSFHEFFPAVRGELVLSFPDDEYSE